MELDFRELGLASCTGWMEEKRMAERLPQARGVGRMGEASRSNVLRS